MKTKSVLSTGNNNICRPGEAYCEVILLRVRFALT